MSDHIPEEIQVNILKHLPVRSLLRFRCVCKSWKQLIDSQSFTKDHLAIQNRGFIVEYAGPGLLVLDPLTLPDTSNGPLETQFPFSLVGSLHGIVCLVECYDGIRLWNPSIRKFFSVPAPPRDHWFGANDEQTTTYTSFWIDPSTKVFKLFMVVFGDDYDGEGLFYSSVQQDWRKFDLPEVKHCKPLPPILTGLGCPALVIGDVAYWIAELRGEEDEEGDSIDVVVVWSYDFRRERFEIMEAPSMEYEDLVNTYPMLCNWEDNLSLVYLDAEKRCDVYLKQGGSWVNMFRLSLPSNISSVFWVVREMGEKCRVLVEEDYNVLATIKSELVLCDDRDGCIVAKSNWLDGKFTYATKSHCYGEFFVTYGFVESLLFP